jgi:hypothetical protein
MYSGLIICSLCACERVWCVRIYVSTCGVWCARICLHVVCGVRFARVCMCLHVACGVRCAREYMCLHVVYGVSVCP